jgi:hypothetical protein
MLSAPSSVGSEHVVSPVVQPGSTRAGWKGASAAGVASVTAATSAGAAVEDEGSAGAGAAVASSSSFAFFVADHHECTCATSGHGHRWCGRSHLLHVRCASISCGREAWARRRTCRMPSGVVRPIRCAIAVVFAAQRHEVALHAGCAGRSSTRPDGERPPIVHTAVRCGALVYTSIEATSAAVCRALKSRAN